MDSASQSTIPSATPSSSEAYPPIDGVCGSRWCLHRQHHLYLSWRLIYVGSIFWIFGFILMIDEVPLSTVCPLIFRTLLQELHRFFQIHKLQIRIKKRRSKEMSAKSWSLRNPLGVKVGSNILNLFLLFLIYLFANVVILAILAAGYGFVLINGLLATHGFEGSWLKADEVAFS